MINNVSNNMFTRRLLIIIFCWIIVLGPGCQEKSIHNLETLVVVNTRSPEYTKCKNMLLPYLDHFGLPYLILDLAVDEINEISSSHPLIIIAHPEIDHNLPDLLSFNDFLRNEINDGSGLVSFDPGLDYLGIEPAEEIARDVNQLIFVNKTHYILDGSSDKDTLKLFGTMNLPVYKPGIFKSLIEYDGKPLLCYNEKENRRIGVWTSMDWMHSDVLGPIAGLDGCLWRSFIWAARKPIIMYVLPSLVTMRVDDVAGRGQIWERSPLYWVEVANEYGFKPWLGLFIYNLTPESIDQLRDLILNGNATASPHAFGRPNRKNDISETYISDNPIDTVSFYYSSQALSLRSETYDEFIYFDHHNNIPWSDSEIENSITALAKWYEENKPLPISKYLIPHWYEIGHNAAKYVKNILKSEYIALAKPVDLPYGNSTNWLVSGPFRLYEEPGSSTGWSRRGGPRPVYYADFIKLGDITLFNSLTEIRDDAGYEWAPDNDIEATVGRGVRQLERAFDSRALAVLFTHETDYIYSIKPENWDKELNLISSGISSYNPIYMKMDDALAIVRAYKTSHISSVVYNIRDQEVDLKFEGEADVQTWIEVFTEDNHVINSDFRLVPSFTGSNQITIDIHDGLLIK